MRVEAEVRAVCLHGTPAVAEPLETGRSLQHILPQASEILDFSPPGLGENSLPWFK